MRQFYAIFPNGHALRGELSWTHYRAFLHVENDVARNWYMEEAIKAGWSSRQLERQISTLYYERLLASRDQVSVIAEAQEKLLTIQPESFIKDPYVLDFLDLKNYPALRESDLEQALIDKLQEFLLELGRGFCFVARQKLMRYEDEDESCICPDQHGRTFSLKIGKNIAMMKIYRYHGCGVLRRNERGRTRSAN